MAETAEAEESYEDEEGLSPLELAQRRQKRWGKELEPSRKELKKFRMEGRMALERFRAERTGDEKNAASEEDKQPRTLNVYTSDKQVLRDTLFGAIPKVDVSRRFGDAKDAPARLAGELLERVLNSDIENDEVSFTGTMEKPLLDFLVPGLGVARARYVMESKWVEHEQGDAETHDEAAESEEQEATEGHEEKGTEDAETFYVHWDGFLWSPTPTWEENRWVGFKCEMSVKDLLGRFTESLARTELQEGAELDEAALARGKALVKLIPLNATAHGNTTDKTDRAEDQKKKNYPWSRAEVWEIWDKERRQVTWYVDGFSRVLDCIEDPLGLKGFWPCPEPMMANLTNDKLVPTSDWKLARSLYEELDGLTSRIGQLELACQVKGVYDRAQPAVQRLVDEALPGEMIPVDNWAMFAEAGGMKGVVDWFPLEMVVATLDKLREVRLETLDLLRQITGMADIVKGQQAENGTPGEAAIKAQFASVRMKALQKRFARFVSELQSIKAEIICKHFDDATILARANYQFMMDAPDPANPQSAVQRQQLLTQALQLLRDKFHEYRIQVRPESIAAEDFAQKQAERTEFIGALGKLFSDAGPMVQAMPGAMPFVAQIAKWAVAGLKGGKEVEGIFDEMVAAAQQQAAQQAQQPQQPNPEAVKAQAAQQQAQAKLQQIQAKAQVDAQHQRQELQNALAQDQAEAAQHSRQEMVAHQLSMQEDRERASLDIQKERMKQAMKPAPVIRPPPNGVKPP